VLYFAHLFSAALLLLLIGAYEGDALRRARALLSRRTLDRALDMMVMALPSALAFLFLKPASAEAGRLEFNLLDTWDDRIGAAFQARFDQPGYVVLALLGLLFVVGLWRGWLRMAPAMRAVLLVLLACAAFAPEWAFGGWAVDMRVPPVLGALAFAASEFRIPPLWEKALAGILLAGLGFVAAAAGGNWAYYDRQYQEFRSALAASPEGTRIFVALDGTAMGLAPDEPYWHMAEFAIADRHGFSSLLFTTAGQHVVRVTRAYQPYAAATAQQGSPPDVGELGDLAAGQIDGDKDIRDTFPYLMLFQCHYDEVVVIRSGGQASPVPDILHLRHRGSFFDLYDLRRDDACTGS
jgi:hypothetical protein